MTNKKRVTKMTKNVKDNGWHALDIVFYVDGMPFNGNTLNQKSLGGSETAGLCMARELAKRGHKVTMFCQYDKEENNATDTYDGVKYKNLGPNSQDFVNYCRFSDADVTIIQRVPRVFSAVGNSKLNILWNHDLAQRQLMPELRGIMANIDETFVLTDFHMKQQKSVYELGETIEVTRPNGTSVHKPNCENFFYKTRNGIDLVDLDPTIKREPKTLIFTGRPERGMDIILDMIPKFWEKDPEIRFKFAGYDHTTAQMKPFYEQLFARIAQHDDRVQHLGALNKKQLYEAYQRSTAYIYPTDFEDTYGIFVLEAQMCGLPCVLTDIAGLKEVSGEHAVFVNNGKNGEGFVDAARSPEFQERFINETIKLLNDQAQQEVIRKDGLRHVKTLTWEANAADWDKHILELFKERTSNQKTMARHFYRHNDMKALWSMDIPEYNEILKSECPQIISDKAFKWVHEEKAEELKADHFKKAEETPRISVIIPTMNIKRANDCLLNLGKKACRIHDYIIVDNRESEVEPAVMPLAALKTIVNTENAGFTKAINQGIKEATSDYIALVNDDIFVNADWDYHLTKLMKDNKIDAISPNYKGVQGYQDILESQKDTEHNMTGSFMLFTRELLEKVGEWDERFFLVFSDVDYEIRMNKLGYKHYVARDVPAFHLHSQSRKEMGIDFDNDWEEKDHIEFEKKYADNQDVLDKHPRQHRKILEQIKKPMFDAPTFDFEDREYEHLGGMKAQYLMANVIPKIKKPPESIMIHGAGIDRDACFMYGYLDCNVAVVNHTTEMNEIAYDYYSKYCTPKNDKTMSFHTPDQLLVGGHDFAWIDDSLEYERNPSKFINELEKTLPDGTFIFITTPINEYKKYKPDGKGKVALWNFNKSDLSDMFTGKQDFNIGVIGNRNSNIKGEVTAWHTTSYIKNSKKKTGKINIDRKLAIQSPKQTITACVITYNSENLLHRTLKSVNDICDDIVICDSGSTDSTIDIARQYTDRIYANPDPKKVGFDEARNQSIQYADSDWTLWIDTDEELLQPWKMIKYIRHNAFNAYAVHQHHFSVMPMNAFKPDLPCRLFRNNKDIKFFGHVHEHPELALNMGIGLTLIIDNNESAIAHDGYFTESGRRDRFTRNRPLLHWDRKELPDRDLGKMLDVRDTFHDAKYLMEMTGGQITPEVIQSCQKAVAIFQQECLGKSELDLMEGLKYYSGALELMNNAGFEITFALDINKGGTNRNPEMKTFRFANKDDFKTFISGQVDTRMKFWECKYV